MTKRNLVYWLVVLLLIVTAVSLFYGQHENAGQKRVPSSQSANISLVVLPGTNPSANVPTGGNPNAGNS